MVIKIFFLLSLAAEYRSRKWVWSTVVQRQCMTLTCKLSWQRLRRSAVPEIWLVPTKI